MKITKTKDMEAIEAGDVVKKMTLNKLTRLFYKVFRRCAAKKELLFMRNNGYPKMLPYTALVADKGSNHKVILGDYLATIEYMHKEYRSAENNVDRAIAYHKRTKTTPSKEMQRIIDTYERLSK